MDEKLKKITILLILMGTCIVFCMSTSFAASGYIDVEVKEAHNSTSDTYSEDGFIVNNATVKVINMSTNKEVLSVNKGSNGIYRIQADSLNTGNYILNISYSTFLTYSTTLTINNTNRATVSHTFVPDISFVCYYTGHKEKIDSLMSISKRVYYIDSEEYEAEKEGKLWLLSYAQFIYLDMYADGLFDFDTEIFHNSPANKNYKIAYCFGDYGDNIYTFGLNFIGANPSNNTAHTIENTFIGSYFRAEAATGMDQQILNENMQNLYDYIRFLLGETSDNPTDDETRLPQLDSIWGIYHPDYGTWEFKITQNQIGTWIRNNPGYYIPDARKLTAGSLNWMLEDYSEWLSSKNISELYFEFEIWYKTVKSHLTSNFVVIASYKAGGVLVDALIKSYEAQGRAAFNVFQIDSQPSMATILLNLSNTLSRPIVAINSLYSWSMDYENMGERGGAIDEYLQINVEILRALHDISEYGFLSELGPQAEWTYSVTIPSIEGVFGAIAVSYVDSSGQTHVISAGVDKLVETTLGWVNLKEKSNEDKKIAIILYNYPPGKAEIGASYLDVFQSVHDLLEQLYDAGYDIGMEKEDIPTVDELVALIQDMGNKGTYAQGLLNEYVEANWDTLMKYGQLIDEKTFNQLISSINEDLISTMLEYWTDGGRLGSIMTYTNVSTNIKYIVIPGMMFGNILLTFQPSRGWDEVENYHDLYLPPHQQYVAFYKWLSSGYNADAMIHLGTHGTLEFLPGRSLGLQDDDWTFALSGIPNIYPYIVSNPGEALVAKERSGALVISHMTPASIISQLYGNYTDLYNAISSYEVNKNQNPENAEYYKNQILELAESLYITGQRESQTFDQWLDEVHHLIEDLQNDIITLGLHTLGYVLTGDEMVQGVITIVSAKTTIYDDIKNFLYPNLSNIKYYDMIHGTNDTKYTNQISAIQNWLTEFVTGLLNGSITNISSFAESNGIAIDSEFYESLVLCNTTIRDIQNNLEWESILKALSGEYVVPGLAVDPAYGDSLPTGGNIYVTDTTKMPSKAAYETAKQIVDKLIVEYYESHNSTFPELVALIMWGTELLRTEGIGIAQFLYFLGVRPVWTSTGVAKDVELISLDELTITLSNGTVIQRPRIDVYASAVTSNSHWIGLMVSAVNLAFNAPNETEAQNYIKKHYNEYPSLDRIFGLPGAVLEGTGMSNYIPTTEKWQNSTNINADLSEIYLSRVSYAWSIDENGKVVIKNNREAFEYLLKNTDLITQNVDSTWRFLDSDDYYDWFGGLLGASQYLGGNPDTAIVDIRNKNNIVTRNLQEQLEFEIRSTILNPLYQDALLSTAAGWNSLAAKYQYIIGFLVVASDQQGNNIISNEVLTGLGNNVLEMGSMVTNANQAYAFQSSAAWMIIAYQKGYWDAPSDTIQQLIDDYIKSVIEYGVSCCHHTCADLEFNKLIVATSSLSSDELQEFSDIVEKANLKDAVYTKGGKNSNNGQSNSNNGQSNNNKGSSSKSTGSDLGELYSSSGSSGGVGNTGLTSQNPRSASFSSSSAGAQSDSGENNAKASEISEQSSSPFGEESSISAAFIAIVLALIALFAVGYLKNRKDREY